MARRAAAAADGDSGSAPTPIGKAKVKLTAYEGKDVRSTSVAITGAGDGLSKAMGVDPVELHHGQRVFVVLEAVVDKVRYDPIKDTEDLTRVHMLKAGIATIVDEGLVRDALDEQKRKIEMASGIMHLPMENNADPEPGADDQPDGEGGGDGDSGDPDPSE